MLVFTLFARTGLVAPFSGSIYVQEDERSSFLKPRIYTDSRGCLKETGNPYVFPPSHFQHLNITHLTVMIMRYHYKIIAGLLGFTFYPLIELLYIRENTFRNGGDSYRSFGHCVTSSR